MELKIYSPQDAGFIQKIDWNFEELKTEIIAVMPRQTGRSLINLRMP